MTDDIDRAAAREQQLRDDALRDHARRAGLAGKTAADSATECGDCGEPIPAGRRRAVPGVRLCVACQALQERRQHRGTP
ncbi:MAG: TraR/DksA family transcriptional regulator [Comamonas sp.]